LALLLAFGVVADGPAADPAGSAQAPVSQEISDERIVYLGGRDLLFSNAIEELMLSDAEVQSQFHRAGIDSACSSYNRALVAVRERYGAEYRSMLISTVREQVPNDVLAHRMNYGWDSGVMTIYKNRVRAAMDRDGADLYSRARHDLREQFLAGVASEPTVDPRNAAGAFAGWDLERPLARKIACMLYRAGPTETFAQRKLPFDGLMQRGAER
jgi:hypothetical protein